MGIVNPVQESSPRQLDVDAIDAAAVAGQVARFIDRSFSRQLPHDPPPARSSELHRCQGAPRQQPEHGNRGGMIPTPASS